MRSGNVINTVAWSVAQAVLQHLKPVNEPQYAYVRTPGQAGTERVQDGHIERRPHENECDVRMFPQMWGSTALGFGGIGGQAMTTAYTVVVEGPEGDAAVYFGGRFAYRIARPNQNFWTAVANQSMPSVAQAVRFEREADREGADQ